MAGFSQTGDISSQSTWRLEKPSREGVLFSSHIISSFIQFHTFSPWFTSKASKCETWDALVEPVNCRFRICCSPILYKDVPWGRNPQCTYCRRPNEPQPWTNHWCRHPVQGTSRLESTDVPMRLTSAVKTPVWVNPNCLDHQGRGQVVTAEKKNMVTTEKKLW